MINRSQQPTIQDFKPLEIKLPAVKTLENGITIYGFEAGMQPITRIELIFDTGARYHRNPLVPMLTNRLLQEGTHTQNAAEIAETFDFCGAYLQNSQAPDFSTICLNTLSKHLNDLLPTFFELLSTPTFPEIELKTILKNNLQDLETNKAKVSFLARRKFNSFLFGAENPYGRFPDVADYEAVKRDDLVHFFEKNYHNKNLTVMVAGKDTAETIEKLIPYLEKIKEKTIENEPFKFEINTAETKKNFVAKKDAVQNALMIGKLCIAKNHPDYIGLKIANTVLGGYFGSRLMSNIREDKGYTYGIGSGMASYKNASFFSIFTEVGSNVSALALTEIYKEIDLLCQKEIDLDELSTVKSYLKGVMLSNFNGAFATADRFKDVHLFGLDMNYYHNFGSELETITPARIQKLMQTYLSPDSFLEVVVGNN